MRVKVVKDSPNPAAHARDVGYGSGDVRAAGVHSTFDLSRALSIHGQKHIWDNISGDALAALSHYKAHKVVWLLKPRPDQTRPDLLDYSLVLFFGSLVLGVGTFRRLRKA